MHTTTTHASHNASALPCSRSGRTTATGQCTRAVLRFEAVTGSPGPAAHLRHTYALVGAVDRATPSATQAGYQAGHRHSSPAEDGRHR